MPDVLIQLDVPICSHGYSFSETTITLWEKITEGYPNLSTQISQGKFDGLLGWLRANIHIHGRKFMPQELVKREPNIGLLKEPSMIYIGPAGENMVRTAAVMSKIAHAAGYGGYGAVMGSKNLKALAPRSGCFPRNTNGFPRRRFGSNAFPSSSCATSRMSARSW
jgi:hypothetical protein